MKRILSLFMTVAMLLSLSLPSAYAEDTVVGEGSCGTAVTWKLTEDGTLTISGSGAMKDYAAYGAERFLAPWRSDLIEFPVYTVVVESGVTSLGDYAFFNQDKLTKVSLPDTLTSIGDGAFENCASLESIELPDTVTAMDAGTFSGCGKLASVKLPAGLAELPYNMFSGCTALTTIELPDGLKSIPARAFSSTGLSGKIVIPDSVETIGINAFEGTALSSIALPDMLESLSSSVLASVQTLRYLEIPASVASVGSNSLSSLWCVEWIRFYGDAPTFNSAAFKNTVTTVYYPEDNPTWTDMVKQNYGGTITWCAIGDDEDLPLPQMYEDVNENSTGEGTIGSTITWSFSNGVLTINGSGYMNLNSKKCSPWYVYRDHIRKVEMSDEIYIIGENAFRDCTALESIALPEQLVQINADAFSNCTTLTEIELPSKVNIIGARAFAGCTALESLEASRLLSIISESAFMDCTSLREIVFPDGMDSIGAYAFAGCTALNSITFLGDPPDMGMSVFYMVTATAYHDVNNTNWTDKERLNYGGSITWTTYGEPSGPPTSGVCGDDARWEYADGVLTITGTGAIYDMRYDEFPWLPFQNELHTVVIGEGITDIGYYAFYACAALTDVTLPSTLKTIRYSAFAMCTGLKEIDIPEGVTEVGGGAAAFSGCTGLERVSLPSTLTRISTECFMNCTSLKKIVIPENVTVIQSDAFAGCTALEEVVLPEGLLTISIAAFTQTALKEIKLPSTLTNIGLWAFEGCAELTSVTLPTSVTLAEAMAFADCASLGNVVFDGNAPQIGENVFENVTATVWYPADNATWTEEIMQQYGGTITWKSYHNGDINGDGAVNNKDATRLFQYLSGWDVDVCFAALDVNGDGAVNNKDATRLFQHLSGWDVEIH